MKLEALLHWAEGYCGVFMHCLTGKRDGQLKNNFTNDHELKKKEFLLLFVLVVTRFYSVNVTRSSPVVSMFLPSRTFSATKAAKK